MTIDPNKPHMLRSAFMTVISKRRAHTTDVCGIIDIKVSFPIITDYLSTLNHCFILQKLGSKRDHPHDQDY